MAIKSGLNNYCWKLWHVQMLSWDGLVGLVAFDKDATHQLGNLKCKALKKPGTTITTNSFAVNCSPAARILTFAPIAVKGLKVWED